MRKVKRLKKSMGKPAFAERPGTATRIRLKRRTGSTVETKWSDLCGIWMTDPPALRRHRGAAVKIARQPETPARVSRREMRIFSYKSFWACDGIVIRATF